MKRVLVNKMNLGLLLIGFSHMCFAVIPTKNWYVSGYLGTFQGNFATQYNDLTDVIPQNINDKFFQYGYTGGVALGYSKVICEQFLLGGEILGQYNSGKGRYASGAATSAFTDRVFFSYNLDLLFVPGVFITDATALYGKVGLAFSQITSQLSSPTGFDPVMVNTNSTQGFFGFAAGLGVKRWVTDVLSVFAEWNYHDFGTVNFPNFQNFTATYNHSVHVYTQGVEVGMSYLF